MLRIWSPDDYTEVINQLLDQSLDKLLSFITMINNKNIASLTSLTPDPAMNQQSITVEVVMVGRGRANLRASPEHSCWGPPSKFSPRFIIQESKARESSEESLYFFEFQDSYLQTHSPPLVEIGNTYMLFISALRTTMNSAQFTQIWPNPRKSIQDNVI